MNLGIIGGTGLYDLPGLGLRAHRVRTRWGEVELRLAEAAGGRLAFLARHGGGHAVPPHAVNYRANIAALKALGIEAVVATAAVGTLSATIPAGSLVLLNDFIDQTSGRPRTFFEERVVHLDYTSPYCPALRAAVAASAERCGVALVPSAVYLCTDGPRFETPAEIRMYRAWGADLVGMTNVPEVVLAREAELCYATVAIATNDAAGVTGHTLTHTEVEEMMAARTADLRRVFADLAGTVEIPDCACRHALDEYRARADGRGLTIPL